jgi:DNA modification methylase
MGSGTTMRVAQKMHRNSVGIEIMDQYYILAKSQILPEANLSEYQLVLLEKRGKYEPFES